MPVVHLKSASMVFLKNVKKTSSEPSQISEIEQFAKLVNGFFSENTPS